MNIDLMAAKTAQEIIGGTDEIEPKTVENVVTKTLGVLQENGVYACILYLYSRSNESDKLISKITSEELLKTIDKLFGEIPKPEDSTSVENVLNFLTDNICSNIDRLFLTKQVWELTLIYARYGAKARK